MLFTRTAWEEASHKKFSGENQFAKSKHLSKLFIEHATSIAKQSGLPLIVITSRDQVGSSFGERLSNAFQNVFDRGYQKIISIGNDCLSLSPTDLREAQHALNLGKSVVGKSISGGAYLIGLNRMKFHSTDFELLQWNTPSLYDSLLTYLSKQHSESLQLTVKADVNNSADLRLAVNQLAGHSRFRAAIESILRNQLIDVPVDEGNESFIVPKLDLSRAPPFLRSF